MHSNPTNAMYYRKKATNTKTFILWKTYSILTWVDRCSRKRGWKSDFDKWHLAFSPFSKWSWFVEGADCLSPQNHMMLTIICSSCKFNFMLNRLAIITHSDPRQSSSLPVHRHGKDLDQVSPPSPGNKKRHHIVSSGIVSYLFYTVNTFREIEVTLTR